MVHVLAGGCPGSGEFDAGRRPSWPRERRRGVRPGATVKIGTAPLEFRVELAQTADQQRGGLGGRESLPEEGTGMLFQFGSRAEQQVWMAGATIPLDVAWIVDGTVLAVDTLQPCTKADQDQCPVWTSPGPVDSLLEVSAQALATVIPGMTITLEEPAS